jgi:hypothetical protein
MTEYKDYTNIAGTPFQPYVKKQIEVRKELIKKENRTSSDLQWLTNKNVWIRISSGTDVELENPRFPLPDEQCDGLAKKYILQAGLTKSTHLSDTDIQYSLRSGIGKDSAYGIGGTDFGYRPMPGLTNLSIKTGGKLGTLREANFDFTCYNMEQLSIMSALYMRLGFGVLIEWGHTPYINNEGRLETNPTPMNFFRIEDKEELMREIQKKRTSHSGNYDALWGTVKNFSYALEDNGTFKCTVSLVGAGDILESLKINQSGNKTDEKVENSADKAKESIYATISDENKSLLNEALYDYYKIVTEKPDINLFPDSRLIFLQIVEKYLKKLDISIIDNNGENIWEKNNELQKKGYHYSIITGLTEGNDNIEIPSISDPFMFLSRLIVNYKIDGKAGGKTNINKPGLEQVYITLGHLLLLIKATGWLYDRNNGSDKPYCYIDVNPETNRCYTFKGHCSLDPTVCLIGSEALPFEIESEYFSKLQEFYPFYDNDSKELGGRFMNTLVNIEHVTSIMKGLSAKNTQGDVFFIDLLQILLNDISKACGGFNEFRIVPDDSSGCIRIFDDRVTSTAINAIAEDDRSSPQISKYLEIPILGKDSIVYKFSYSTKISPQMASSIVISATAQDSGVNLPKDALAFSHLNFGLKNRLAPSRVESVTDINKENEDNNEEEKYIELREHIKGVYDGKGGTKTQREIITEETRANERRRRLPSASGVNR